MLKNPYLDLWIYHYDYLSRERETILLCYEEERSGSVVTCTTRLRVCWLSHTGGEQDTLSTA